MRKYEIYLDNKNRIVIDCFEGVDSEYFYKRLIGKETYDLIKELAFEFIIDTYETNDNMLLEYKDYIVNLNEYQELLLKHGIGPIKNSIEDYEYKKELKKTTKSKVKRVNKYAKKNIIAIGLVSLVLVTGIYGVGSVSKSNAQSNDYSVSMVEETKESNEGIDVVKQKENKEDTKTIKQKDINIPEIYLEYEDRSNAEKAYVTEAYYGEVLNKYAKMYGIDYNIVRAIATQERGIHSNYMDEGGATGLMQIQNEVWLNNEVTAYNYLTNEKETVFVEQSKISDVFSNIKIGCMIFQNCMNYMNNNVLAAIQCYNMGYGSMNYILDVYSKETGNTKDEILKNQEDIGWLKFRDVVKIGDQNYLENVLSWVGDGKNITNKQIVGDDIILKISNINNKKIY